MNEESLLIDRSYCWEEINDLNRDVEELTDDLEYKLQEGYHLEVKIILKKN